MRVRDDGWLAKTLALRDARTAGPAVAALAGASETAAVEGLLELIHAAPSARLTTAAVTAVGGVSHPLAPWAVRAGLACRFAPARLAAVQVAHRSRLKGFADDFARVLREDYSWPNRRAALFALADCGDPARWAVLLAADDPHWRVRHALIRVLLGWGTDEPTQREVEERLGRKPADGRPRALRVEGLLHYLRWAWTGTAPADWNALTPPDPAARCPFWDWDPAVLTAKLARLGPAGRLRHLDALPFLAGHDDDRVWKPAVDALRDHGEPRHLAGVIALLADPRTGAAAAVARLFDGHPEDAADAVADHIRGLADATPAQRRWAADRLDGPPSEPPPEYPPSHPFARAAALTPERAAELVADPDRETSWHVLEAACRLAKVPLWEVEPANRWQPVVTPRPPAEPLSVTVGPSPHSARLGRGGPAVSRVGVSGHYLLPVEGFCRAAEAGVNWFFWEPNYDTLTAFLARLSPADRRRFHLVAGTFEADPVRIRKDAERAVKMLGVERLGLFLLFWVQSWDRLDGGVRQAVERLKIDGLAACVGLSSHYRPLAVRAMEGGWDPVMVRHSAAHRGAETAVFPRAVELGTTVLTFNALCYGRLLQPVAGLTPPDPADCYRYSLKQPGVAACWSAPSTLAQLEANLAALREPDLPADRRDRLLRFGDALYREETAFRRLVRVL